MNLQYLTSLLKVLSVHKALILEPLFVHFSDPILGPPLEEPFGPPWPPKVPTLPPHVDFGTFLGPPWGPKWDLGAPRCDQEGPKKLVPRVSFEDPWPSWERPVFRRVPASHSYRFWVPLGSPRRVFGTPLGDIRLVWDPVGDTKLGFQRILRLKAL